MSDLSVTQREKIKDPAEHFGDPGNRLFPIIDQSDVDAAAKLIGKAKSPTKVKANIKKIAKAKDLTLPDTWQAEDAAKLSKDEPMSQKNAAVFSATAFALDDKAKPSPDGEYVRRKAPIIFRAGEYPDKDFAMTPEELQDAVATFSPVDIGLEHVPTVLNGKLGKIVTVGLSDNWQDMHGEAEIPRWLDDVLTRDDRKLSVAFDRSTKKIIGCDLVRTPRVKDAVLLAAFSKKHTPTAAPATSKVAPTPAATPKPEPEEIPTKPALFDDSDAEMSKESGEPSTESGPVECADDGSNKQTKAKKTKKAKPMDDNETPETEGSTPSTADFKSQQEELQRLRDQVAEERKHRVAAEAITFAKDEIAANRSMPAEKDALVFAYTLAANDDAALGNKVQFSGKTLTRVEALKLQHSARVAHNLDKETLLPSKGKDRATFSADSVQVLRNGNEVEPMTPERRKQLLEATPTGRGISKSMKRE